MRPAHASDRAFHKEAALYERLRGRVPVPEVIGVGGEAGGAYMLLHRSPGESLTRRWLAEPSPRVREWLLAQWIEILRALHTERYDACGELTGAADVEPVRWPAFIGGRIERRVAALRALPAADAGLLAAAEAFSTARLAALELADPRLVHWDLHWGNVLAEGSRITAMLDFESALAAPVDLELDQVYRFLRWPALFVEGDLAARARPEAFAEVWPALRRGYPELFAAPRLAERLSLYALDYDLARLRQALEGRFAPEAITQRIAAILEGRYLPPLP